MNDQLKIVKPKNIDVISAEWDCLCARRQETIEQGKDISLSFVTSPCILGEMEKEHPDSVLDVGCGTGYLTSLLAKRTKRCVGIDMSAESIHIAKQRYGESGASFITTTIEQYQAIEKFDICVANMVFSCDPDWIKSICVIRKLLNDSGKLYVMLPHPVLWSKYWGFQDAEWYHYNKEIFIEHNFSVSLVKSMGIATYIHRPLASYINDLLVNGFRLEQVIEPYPIKCTPTEYKYDYPRFLFMKSQKNRID